LALALSGILLTGPAQFILHSSVNFYNSLLTAEISKSKKRHVEEAAQGVDASRRET
jgi:hypothetical protein